MKSTGAQSQAKDNSKQKVEIKRQAVSQLVRILKV